MTPILSGAIITQEEQEINNRHNPLMVFAVLGFLAVFIYLFTYASKSLDLPMPQDLSESLGLHVDHVFDSDRNVDSSLYVPFTNIFIHNDDERLVLFLGAGFAFLLVYFIPLKHKQRSLVFSSLIIIGILYGDEGVAGLLCAHSLVYLILHPVAGFRLSIAFLPGFFAFWGFYSYFSSGPVPLLQSVLAGSISILIYRYSILPILAFPNAAKILRVVIVQSALITILVGALLEGWLTETWKLALGVLLFFWHWERLFMYHIDYQDGKIPKNISLMTYLSVFLTPGQIGNWNWGVTIGQGYAYTVNNFLCEDKNKLILGGLKLWLVSLGYLVLGDWIHANLLTFFNDHGVLVYRRIEHMSSDFVSGSSMGSATVLLTTLIALMKWTFSWGGVVHFKVGLWRVCGYRIDPYFNYPWLSTNLVSLWSRFTFHYREFLVRAFYYPVFFKFFKNHTHLRIFTATMAAACFGNLIWGHMTEAVFYNGVERNSLLISLKQWPYFVLLGLGITASEFWLLHKKKTSRRPWTPDKYIGWDILSAYVTLQYFAMIHIFVNTVPQATLWDNCRLFLAGLGIQF
jgi:hypothetical protein